jgi:trans-aconitate 2-methyltransferase
MSVYSRPRARVGAAPARSVAQVTSWDDGQYLKFADERTRPARELLARVPVERPERVVDLGCGPGNSTALLLARWPGARTTGVDSSLEMLARARVDVPQGQFLQADLTDFELGEPVDVVFANAVLQWVPDPEAVLVRMAGSVAPGGALAFQIPVNMQEPSHQLMASVPGPWQGRLAALTPRTTRGTAQTYYDLLAPLSARVDVWETTYQHVMASPESIVEWVKGTGLRPYLDAVEPAEREAYLSAYTAAIDEAYPPRSDGNRLFRFPRLSLVASF